MDTTRNNHPGSAVEPFCRSGANPPGRPLTRDEQHRACELLLDFVQRSLRARLGPSAVEFAGLAIVRALQSYDGSTPLRAWVARKAHWIARTELHAMQGRPGTARHAARKSQFSLHAADQPRASHVPASLNPHRIAEQRDLFARVLATAEQLDDLPRMIALGRLIGGFDHRDIASLLNVSARTAANSLALVRRSIVID